jgi:two-component system NarL family sensor kinase
VSAAEQGKAEKRRRAATRSAAREIGVLNAVAEALSTASDVRAALQRTLELVADLLGLRTGWVWLVDRETGQYYNAAARHLPPYLREPVRMTGDWCWCLESFSDGELTPQNINVIECSRLRPAVRAQSIDLTEGLASHASIPLYFGDTPLGVMNLAAPSWRELTTEELRLLETIARQVGIALERARLAGESARLARVEERTRIAREIHDTLAQGLTAIALDVEGGLHNLERDPARARGRLERALATARASLEEARRSVLDLRTVPLAGTPLPEALAALGRAFTSETGVRVQVRAGGGSVAALPLRIEAELYRIAQEALTNVRRHANATEVVITLRADARSIRLAIRDDGVGFVAGGQRPAGGEQPAEERPCFGILGMRERARLVGGRLRIESRPGAGTTIRATVPLPVEGT